MSRVEGRLTWQGEDPVANRVEQRTCIPAGQVGPSDRTREYAVANERCVLCHEHDASRGVTGCMADLKPERAELQHLSVRQCPIGQRLRRYLETEHQGLLGSRPVQVEVCRVEIDRARIALHKSADGGHVIQVGVRQENRLGNRLPGIQGARDPLGLGARIDDHHGSLFSPGSEEVAVRLECADGEGENLEPTDVVGGVQTEKEVPQPQEPVAFGFSNVKPEPLKLLW